LNGRSTSVAGSSFRHRQTRAWRSAWLDAGAGLYCTFDVPSCGRALVGDSDNAHRAPKAQPARNRSGKRTADACRLWRDPATHST